LIKSLCLIHGLYGYPAETDKPGKNDWTVISIVFLNVKLAMLRLY
jgi:hypothetical protein